MENKYYTPEIEEFHVGFEYEINQPIGTSEDSHGNMRYKDNWITKKIRDHWDFPENKDMKFASSLYRVKYLDKKDIENLGFINLVDTDSFDYGDFQLYFQSFEFVQIFNFDNNIIFEGEIKNKSELIKLMKKLSIKK